MDFVKKLLSEDEISQAEQIIFNSLKLPNEYFKYNTIDYYDEDTSLDLIVEFLNNFSSKIDDEIDFHDDFSKFDLNITLIKPITDEKILEFNINKNNDNFQFKVTHNNNTVKINPVLFNTIMAYLVCHGVIYDFELESIIEQAKN